ncbi:transposon Tf2-9 polyprotein [Trichonephila clavipes]|nr:transposon Tf2-9 polyprotein [Trichonephila clavipes]
MEQQIADLLQQNQDWIRALQIRDDSHSHKVTVHAKLYQLLKNLLAPDIPSDQTLDKLKEALKKHLTPKPLIIPSRHKFLNRKQTEGEGISTYIAELRALAMNCDYDKDMLNIMLRDVFVSGLRDKMILDRLFEEDNINLEKTLNIALAMEKAFRGTDDIMGRAINSMRTFKKHMDKKNPILQKSRKKKLYCSRCTGTNHAKENCRFISSKCNFCGKIGHIKQACFASKKANAKSVKQKQVTLLNEDRNRIPLYELKIQDYILHEEEPKRPPIMINLKIENKSCSMELDTGGAVSVMSIGNFRKISNKPIKPTNIVFKTYKGDSIIPLGYVTVRVQYKNQNVNLNLYIVKENLDTILGREWLYKIHLDWPAIKAFRAKTEQNLNNLLREYKDIFDDKLGEINNYEAKLKLRHGIKPIFCRVRTVPFALKGRVENEIDRLEKRVS